MVTGDARLCVCTLYILLTMQINNRNCGQITFLYLKDGLFWMEKINWLFLCPFLNRYFIVIFILKVLLMITLTLHYIVQQKYCQVCYFMPEM